MSNEPHIEYSKGSFEESLLLLSLVVVQEIEQIGQAYGLLLSLFVVLFSLVVVDDVESFMYLMDFLSILFRNISFYDEFQGVIVHIL